jgi:hypothetical protein
VVPSKKYGLGTLPDVANEPVGEPDGNGSEGTNVNTSPVPTCTEPETLTCP